MFKEGFILDKIQEECACNRMWFRRDSIQPSTHTTKVISAVRVKHSPVKKKSVEKPIRGMHLIGAN